MGDYIFPEWVVKIMKAPSDRTQMESSLVGITVMMLGSLGVTTYMLANGIITGFWFTLLICASALGLLSFQFSLLTNTYQTYHTYKLEKGLYPINYRLKLKVQQAKEMKEELENIINEIELKEKEVKNKC